MLVAVAMAIATVASTSINASALAARLHAEHFVFVNAAALWPLLASLGASESDLAPLAELWSEAVPQRDERGNLVYPHKGTLTSYYVGGGGGDDGVDDDFGGGDGTGGGCEGG